MKPPPLTDYLELGPPVLRPALFRAIVGDRNPLAISLVLQPVCGNALAHKVFINRLGPVLGKSVVVFIRALVVGMSANLNTQCGVLAQVVGQAVELHKRLRLEFGAVEVKEDILQCNHRSDIRGLEGDVLEIGGEFRIAAFQLEVLGVERIVRMGNIKQDIATRMDTGEIATVFGIRRGRSK